MKIEIALEFEKETKSTYRYKANDSSYVNTLYVNKSAIDELKLNKEDKLIITLERGDAYGINK